MALKTKLIIFLIVVVTLSSVITYFLNIFLPKKIKSQVENLIKETVGAETGISQIKIGIMRGIDFKGVTLYNTRENATYIKIKRLNILPAYFSFILQRKLTVSLSAEGIYFPLIKREDGSFNLPTIKPLSKEKLTFFIKKISLKNINLDFKDEKENFKKTITNLSVVAAFKIPSQVNFEANWANNLFLKGMYEINSCSLKTNISLNDIDLAEFTPYLKKLDLNGGRIKKGAINIEGAGTYNLKGNLEIESLSLLKENIGLKGDLRLKPQLVFSKDNLSYYCEGSLYKGILSNLPIVNQLSGVEATFILNKERFSVLSFKAIFKDNPIEAKGEISYLDELTLYMEGNHSSPLPQFIGNIKDIKSFSFEYTGPGTIEMKFVVKGNLRQKEFDYHIDYRINNAALADLRDIVANGYLQKDNFILEEASLNYRNIPLYLKGKIENFLLPKIELNIISDIFNLEAKGIYDKGILEIKELFLKGKGSKILAKAKVETKKEPVIQINGFGHIDCLDVLSVMRKFNLNYPLLDKLNLQGSLDTKFIINGGFKPQEWQVKLAGLAEKLKAYGLEAREIQLELYKDKNELIISPLIANLAKGKIDFRTKFNFSNNKGVVNLVINEVDLAEIKKQLNLKNKNLSGKLSLEAYVDNNNFPQWNKLEGEGKILIKEGNIWELNFLKGLGEFLFIPDFEKITFEEGYSDVVFKNEEIILYNLELNSPQMDLNGAGKISFKGDMNFLLFPQFNPLVISSSESLKKITTGLLGKALLIQIEGNINNPKYQLKPTLMYPLKKIKDFFENLLN
jgi:hypothetical protein